MRIDVLTIFPDMVGDFADQSLLGRARATACSTSGCTTCATPRATTTAPSTTPRSAGARAWCSWPSRSSRPSKRSSRPGRCCCSAPGGRTLDQAYARELAGLEGFSLLCGRYEGVDERVRTHLVDGEISIGDYVLAGGEVAAMVILEAVGRLVPGVMGNDTSADDESFTDGLLEYPQYTKPAELRGWPVPEVLRSGDHGRVARWRRAQALRRTIERRPDLIEARGGISDDEQRLLDELAPDD